jgi:hypothetical protein
MAVLAAGSLANVYASLDAYCTTHLIDSAGLAVKLHGVRRFIVPVDAPWVEVSYAFLGLQSQHVRQMYSRTPGMPMDVYGTARSGQLQVDIFQRARIFIQRYTTAAARDIVVGAFPEGSLIEIYDYAGVPPDTAPDSVGVIILDGLTETVEDMGMESGVTHHVIQVQTRYLEHFTRG